jgi:hypothetical protein
MKRSMSIGYRRHDAMTDERRAAFILDQLSAQAALLWGEADAKQQVDALHETAEQLALIRQQAIAADLEPRFY